MRAPNASASRQVVKQLKVAVVSLFMAAGPMVVMVAASSPANADGGMPNLMRCEPDTGWCYQTNPLYSPDVPHVCQWDYTLHNLYSGMWYTGCDIWWEDIH